MRRQMGKLFPIVMIAIWVQLVAPIGAYWMMAAAMDPFGSAPICAPSLVCKAGQSTPAGQPQSHPDCCSLCVVAHSGAAPLTSPTPIMAAISLSFQRIAWHDQYVVERSAERGSHAQARAPPSYS